MGANRLTTPCDKIPPKIPVTTCGHPMTNINPDAIAGGRLTHINSREKAR